MFLRVVLPLYGRAVDIFYAYRGLAVKISRVGHFRSELDIENVQNILVSYAGDNVTMQ